MTNSIAVQRSLELAKLSEDDILYFMGEHLSGEIGADKVPRKKAIQDALEWLKLHKTEIIQQFRAAELPKKFKEYSERNEYLAAAAVCDAISAYATQAALPFPAFLLAALILKKANDWLLS